PPLQPRSAPPCPYTTLFRSQLWVRQHEPSQSQLLGLVRSQRITAMTDHSVEALGQLLQHDIGTSHVEGCRQVFGGGLRVGDGEVDRKSTRLNSSHVSISYAV